MNAAMIGLIIAGIYLYSKSQKKPVKKSGETITFPGYEITNCNTININNTNEAFQYAFNSGQKFTTNDNLIKDLFGNCINKLKINELNAQYTYMLLFRAYAGAYYSEKIEVKDINNYLQNILTKFKSTNIFSIELFDIENIINQYSPQKINKTDIPKEVSIPKGEIDLQILNPEVIDTSANNGSMEIANYVLFSGSGNKTLPLIIGLPNQPKDFPLDDEGLKTEMFLDKATEMLNTLTGIVNNKANIIVFPYILFNKTDLDFEVNITTAIMNTLNQFINKLNPDEIIIVSSGSGAIPAIKLALKNQASKVFLYDPMFSETIYTDIAGSNKNDSKIRVINTTNWGPTSPIIKLVGKLQNKIPNIKYYELNVDKNVSDMKTINELLNGLLLATYPWWS